MRSNYEKNHPEPKPPLKEIKIEGDESDWVEQKSDPTYVAALAEWTKKDAKFSILAMRMVYARRGLKSPVDQQAVTAILEDLPNLQAGLQSEYAEYGLTFDERYLNQYVYLWYVCIGTAQDYSDLVTVMTTRTQPTPDLVAASVKSFPS
jgi:hypothetical protein